MTLKKTMGRCALLMACAPLLFLAGCPDDQLPAPGKLPAQATAPALPAAKGAAPAATAAAPPATTPSASSSANTLKNQALINKAEASYRSGVVNYQANRLDAARVDFDTAVDGMLASGLDLKNDPQLAEEFEHLLDAINALEMSALKQGNGLSPKLEEAPLENTENLTFTANPELTAKLKSELQTKSDLPLVINDEVAGYIGYFANSPSFRAHMVHSLQRGGRYQAIIQKALADQGLPQDLFYLAVAESGFQPQALNARSGAGGMWQFMPTGAYGLARNGYFDERFDPEKSSVAYAKYMKTLYNQLGDWYLAMAGYDWGPGYVQRAVQRTGYADFWELYRRNMLPKETKDYVPKILAAIIMAKNPVKYGLDKVVPDAAVVSDTVNVAYAIDMRLVADVTNASLPEIVALNPSLLRMSTPGDLSFDLHIPIGTKDVFAERVKSVPEEKRSSWRFHVVRSGETLDMIATSFHAHANDVIDANELKASDVVEEGDELVVPVTIASAGIRPQKYVVRRGDTLITIADRFNISVEDLRSWNKLSGGAARAGQALNVAEPVRFAPSIRGRRTASRSGRGRSSRGAGASSYRSLKPTSGAALKTSNAFPKRASSASSKALLRGTTKSAHGSSAPSQGVTPKTKKKAAR